MIQNVRPLSKSIEKRIKKLHQKKFRLRERMFIAEGLNSLEASLAGSSHPACKIIISEAFMESLLKRIPMADIPQEIGLLEASEKQMRDISTEETPQGIVTLCSTTTFDFEDLFQHLPDRVIYLDRVSDPGNLGTIIRTAAWFGMAHILLSPDCVDPFNTKTVRASAGSIFNVEIHQSVHHEELSRLAEEGKYEVAVTTPRGGVPPSEWIRADRTILILGKEADGVSPILIEKADSLLTIKGEGKTESLNLASAAAILIYELSRK